MSARGFILVPVLAFILVFAVLAYGASRGGPAAVAQLARAEEAVAARYAAEAGLAHATWRAQESDCGSYANVVDEPFGSASYDVSYSASSGSPVTVSATGALASGAASVLARTIDVHQRSLTTVDSQPGPANADTSIETGGGGGTGGNNTLKVWKQGGQEERALLQVDVGMVPAGVYVASATLELNAKSVNVTAGAEVTAQGLTRAWSEANATWYQYDFGAFFVPAYWSTPGGDFDANPAGHLALDGSTGWKSLDLTALVQDWLAGRPNDGVLLKANSAVSKFEFYSSDESDPTKRPKIVIQYACLCGSPCAAPLTSMLVLSTLDDATLAGVSFLDGDLVRHEPTAPITIPVLGESDLFAAADEDIDAVHVYADGRVVLSTDTAASVAGLAFQDEDLVEYDPTTTTATLIFDGSARFAVDEDVEGVHVYDDGRIVLSTDSAASLAGLAFEDEDLVEYNPAANTATLIFDGSAHMSTTVKVDGAQMLDDGRFLLSTDASATLGGLSFTDADIVLYDPLEKTTVKVFDGATLTSSGDADVDAVHDFRPHPLGNELRLEPVADTYIDSGAPSTAFGSASNLRISNTLRTLLRFDLSALPAGATLTSAALYLDLDASAAAVTIGAYRVTAAWDESTATWTSTGGGSFVSPSLATAAFTPAAAIWVKWTLPIALIQEWRDGVSPNDGLLLKSTILTTVQATGRSRNHTSTAVHPRLVLKYTLP